MSKYTEHFMDELKQIVEKINTTPEKVESISTFVAMAKFDYDFIKYIICNIKETWVIDKAIQVIADTWNEYLNKHDDICYNISYTEDYSLETGGISRVRRPLMKIPKFLDIEKSLSEIKESELNRRKVNVIYEKGLSSMKDKKTIKSDFDHLKNWKDNPDLDYYLSENHWNYIVNHLLYKYLKVRYYGNEVGVYINLVLLNGLDSTKQDYNQIYGVMFNEAYCFCSYVLNTPVPETKIKKMEKEAAGLCHVELAAPIIAYNILVMTGLLLCYANDRTDAVGRFLNYLSNHNSTHFFGDKFHHFEDYIKIGLDGVAAIMIDSRLQPPGKLRLGYNYKTQDEYLRKTIPCYRVSAERFEKRIEEADKKNNPQNNHEEKGADLSNLNKEDKNNKKQVVTDFEVALKEIKNASCLWDDSRDYIFNEKVNTKEIFKALNDVIPDNNLNEKPRFYVAYKVLIILKYLKYETTAKDFLRWINLHFNCGWSSDNDFKFRFNNLKEIKNVHPAKWNSIEIKSDLNNLCYNYAIKLKNTFTYTIVNGREIDDSILFEHLKDKPIFLKKSTNIFGKHIIGEKSDYINDGK